MWSILNTITRRQRKKAMLAARLKSNVVFCILPYQKSPTVREDDEIFDALSVLKRLQ